jgi:PTS system nitrogen regulatory IIA component
MNLSVKDAAKLLSVSEKTIYRWIKQELVPSYRIHGSHRFNRAELVDWATSRKTGVSPEAYCAPERNDAPLPGISQALQAGGIIYRLEGQGRDEALAALVEQVRLPEGFDRDYLLRMLVAREELGTTAVGDGIAIPHFRSPGLIDLSQPTLTLAFLEGPVDFGALDGCPVEILFLPLSSTLRGHLHLLSNLAHMLRNREVQDTLRRQLGREKILQAIDQVEIHARSSQPAATTAESRS